MIFSKVSERNRVIIAVVLFVVLFGVMLTMNLAIGFVTPPYGIDLFVASAISKEPMSRMIKPTLRFIVALLIVLMLVTFCEPFTMGVLNLMKSAGT